jgi:hypothetical protein
MPDGLLPFVLWYTITGTSGDETLVGKCHPTDGDRHPTIVVRAV